MKKFLVFIMLLCAFSMFGHAQVIFKGSVLDSSSNTILFPVSIENLTTHKGVFSNEKGEFSIEGKVGDFILFSYIGYKNKILSIKSAINVYTQNVYLSNKTITLGTVKVKKGLTEYQKDSVERASIYKDVFQYSQEKSIQAPISSVYQKFSKKYKNLRKFQGQIVDMEKQKFIDSRYTPEITNAMTHLEDDELMFFINQYPMDYDYARVASDLEVKMWIKFNFQDYTKKKSVDTQSQNNK